MPILSSPSFTVNREIERTILCTSLSNIQQFCIKTGMSPAMKFFSEDVI